MLALEMPSATPRLCLKGQRLPISWPRRAEGEPAAHPLRAPRRSESLGFRACKVEGLREPPSPVVLLWDHPSTSGCSGLITFSKPRGHLLCTRHDAGH